MLGSCSTLARCSHFTRRCASSGSASCRSPTPRRAPRTGASAAASSRACAGSSGRSSAKIFRPRSPSATRAFCSRDHVTSTQPQGAQSSSTTRGAPSWTGASSAATSGIGSTALACAPRTEWRSACTSAACTTRAGASLPDRTDGACSTRATATSSSTTKRRTSQPGFTHTQSRRCRCGRRALERAVGTIHSGGVMGASGEGACVIGIVV
mmetsp:Transcript_15439/g.50757  ORF Transcript_15439/g.50757 Transcript_15439/m.50757 type:complete len:210 (+) Transcript_15439:827-1456(+)